MSHDQRDTLDEHWDSLVIKQLRRVKSQRTRDRITGAHDAVSFRMDLERMSYELRNTKTVKGLSKLEPSIQHLQVFTSAINNFVQAQPNPLAFIWGTIQLVLASASQYLSTLDLMTAMLGDLISTLSRFNRYLEFLPDNSTLQQYLLFLCDDYVGFCVDSINFYDKCRWYTVCKFMWCTVKESFNVANAKISRHIKEFEDEVRTNIDDLTVRSFRELKGQPPLVHKIETGPIYIYDVPLSRNELFVGRERELACLKQELYPPDSARPPQRRVCVIHSMGGVGKTQLALEYTYRFRESYSEIFWLAAETGPGLAREFASLSRYAPVGQKAREDSASLARDVQTVKDWLQQKNSKWLIVYDNVEAWDIIKPYWPHGINGSIIITSQSSALRQVSGGSEIALEPFQPEDGACLLLKHLNCKHVEAQEDRLDKAAEISRSLGGLPIAISHMAGYIDLTQSSLEEFAILYEDRQHSRKIWDYDFRSATYQYDRQLDKVWTIALARLPSKAKSMIRMLSMFSPTRICEHMLFGAQDGMDFNPRAKGVIHSLRDRQLVQREMILGRPFWSIHRALQLSLLHELDGAVDLRQEIFEQCVSIVRRAYPRQSEIQAPSNEHWAAEEECLPHVLHLQRVFEQSHPPMSGTRDFAELLGDVGNYMWERALYEQGLQSLLLAEKLYDENQWSDLLAHSKVLTIIGVLSNEVGMSGRLKGADSCVKSLRLRQQYFEQAPAMVTPASESDHLLLANAWNDVGCSLLEYSDYRQAEAFILQSLKIKRDFGLTENGQAAFNYAENLKNLAIAKISQGFIGAANDLSEEAVLLIQEHAGSATATTQAFRFHQAYTMYAIGDYEGSLRQHLNVLDARIKIFGNDEVHSLNSYYACAVVLQARNRLLDAEKMILQSLLSENSKWPLECKARAKFRLSTIYRGLGWDEKANKMSLEASSCCGSLRVLGSWQQNDTADMQADSMVFYDHLVSFEAGRVTFLTSETKQLNLSMVPA